MKYLKKSLIQIPDVNENGRKTIWLERNTKINIISMTKIANDWWELCTLKEMKQNIQRKT